MMHEPLVSIIIPVYNCQRYLAKTIESALSQTWKNKEVLIVDDGSTDESLNIAKTFESEIVKVFSQENKGASAARNLGLSQCKGEYVQFLDADDLLSYNKIERQLKHQINFPEHLAICGTVHFYDFEDPLDKSPDSLENSFYYTTNKPSEFLLNLYGQGGNAGMITIHSWLTPKILIDQAGGWNENLSVDDDGEFFCRVVLKAKGIIFVEGVFNYYRKYHQGNNLANQKSLKAMQSTYNALVLKEKHMLQECLDEDVTTIFGHAFYKLAVSCYPKYKEVYESSLKSANDRLSTAKPKLFIGSKVADLIANKVSWKLARNLQFYTQQFKSIFNR